MFFLFVSIYRLEIVKIFYFFQFPISSCRIKAQATDRRDEIEKQAASVYPILHERAFMLYLMFLEYKTNHGSSVEKALYKDMTVSGLVQRLLQKRAVTFLNSFDSYLLMSGVSGAGGFEEIGTDNEKPSLSLVDCLSYDEIKLSALLSVSSQTEFLNNGHRANVGRIEKDTNTIERDGVIIGIIGARFERPLMMEYQDILITKQQNTLANGYGTMPTTKLDESLINKFEYRKIWNWFYNEKSLLYDEVSEQDKRFRPIGFVTGKKLDVDLFDQIVMEKRYSISFDTLLIESDYRASVLKKKAFIHVVGIGLGVWKATDCQNKVFLECFESRIKALIYPQLKHVSHICFAYFDQESGDLKDGGFIQSSKHPLGGIKILMNKRNPADKLIGDEYKDALVIESYAWDGNALPGNEFWKVRFLN